MKAELTGRVAALSEDSAAYKLAIERLLAAKASRDKQIAAIIAERNKIAQVLARNRVAERELDRDDTRRHSTDRLSSGSARRASSSSSSGRMDEQQQAGVSVSGKRQFGSLEAEDGAQPKERRSLAATPPARRAALSPVSPNSQAGTAAMSPRSHDTDKAQPEREREQRLMARVKATLARPTDDGTSVSAAGIDDGPLSPSAGWLSREEALHARRTSERMKRSVQLLEDKCHELEKVGTARHYILRAQPHQCSTHASVADRVLACPDGDFALLSPVLPRLLCCAVLCCAVLCCCVGAASLRSVCRQSLFDGSLSGRLRGAPQSGEEAAGGRRAAAAAAALLGSHTALAPLTSSAPRSAVHTEPSGSCTPTSPLS